MNWYKKQLKIADKEDDKFIVNLYLLPPKGKGLSSQKITEQYGFGLRKVKGALRRLGLLDFYRGRSEANKRTWTPERKKRQSDLLTEKHKENPGLGKEHSRKMVEYWKQFESEDGGKYENYLLSLPTKQQAMNNLNGIFYRWKETNGATFANVAYDKYLKFINDHTFPDDTPPPQEVVASMNWYKKQLKIAKDIRPVRKWTSEELEQIEELVKKRIPFIQIAKMFDVNKKNILNLNKKYKWRDIKKEREDYDKRVADLYLLPPFGKGLGVKEITEQTGINSKSVYNALKRLGLEDKIRDGSYAQNKRWSNPEEREEQSKRQKQFYKDNPEVKEQQRERMQQRYIDNPGLREEHSKFMTEFWKDNPEGREERSKKTKQQFEDISQRERLSRIQKQRYIDNPELAKNMSEKQKQLHKDNPELAKQRSERLKQFYKDNPELAKQRGEKLRQMYIDNPELRDEMVRMQKQRYIDNPELRRQVSERRKKEIADIGGFEGMLRACATKDKAIAMLNHNVRRIGQEGDNEKAYHVYNKYMQIINDHFPDEIPPDEIPPQQEVVASMNWYKRSQFDYEEEEDRTTISSPQGNTVVTETYPRYEFMEDLTPEEFDALGVDEDEPIAKIEHLEVDIASRGLGYGGKLFAEAIQKAQSMAVDFIYLNACPMGMDSLSLDDLTVFYQKYGFFVFKSQGNNNLMGMHNR